MSISITCPKCRATLKANKAPRPDKILQCLKCSHRFTSDESADESTATSSPSAEKASNGSGLSFGAMPALIIAGVVVVAVVAIVAGTMASRPAEKTPVALIETPPSKPKIDANIEPKPRPEPKVEPKPEPAPKETKVDAELDAKRQQFTNLMIEAGIAANLKKFDEAIAAYTLAQKLFPEDESLKKKLADAQAAAAESEKTKLESAKLAEETAALILRGDKAASKEQFAAAIDFYKLALGKSPTSDEAADKLVDAQDKLQKADAAQKKLEKFDQHIIAGKAALKAGNTADAIREFNAAAKVLPTDPLPAELLKDADKQLGEIKNEADRKKQYQNLIDQGNAFLRLQNLEDARDAYKQALKLFPNDAVAQKGLADVQKGAKKNQGDIAGLMKQAQAAVMQNQLPLAMQYLKEAEQIAPNDANLLRAIKAAELIQLNQVAYYAAMNRGIAAMNLHAYADAVIAFSDALRLAPGDFWASAMLFDAQQGLAAANRRRLEYDRLVGQGMQQMRSRFYSEAYKSFEAAVALVRPAAPDPQIMTLARYCQAMAAGANLMAARQFAQAAQQYQIALNEIPGDQQAFLNQQKARVQANQPK